MIVSAAPSLSQQLQAEIMAGGLVPPETQFRACADPLKLGEGADLVVLPWMKNGRKLDRVLDAWFAVRPDGEHRALLLIRDLVVPVEARLLVDLGSILRIEMRRGEMVANLFLKLYSRHKEGDSYDGPAFVTAKYGLAVSGEPLLAESLVVS